MATQKVNIDISTRGAKKSKEELSGLNGAISKMGKAVGVASAAYFGAKGLISAFSTVIEASARQEQAEKALEVALGKTSTALLKQASSLQQVTTAGDEAIIEQQAFLASLKFTEDQIKEIIPVALDLSAATGISLESAVRNTSKTFSGLAGELGELVPQLRDLTTEEMKAGEAVKVLGELFKGQATKQADTLAGSLEQMSNAVGDASEAIGSLLSPMVIKTAGAIKTLAEGVGSVIDRFKDFGKEVDAVLLDKTQIADETIKNFRQTIKGLSTDELIKLGESLQGNKQVFIDYTGIIDNAGSASDVINQKLTILNEVIQSNKEHTDKMNATIDDGLKLREQESSIFEGFDENFNNFVETQRQNLFAQEQEQANIARLIQLYPKLAEKLGLVKKTEKELRQEKEKRIQQDLRSAIIAGQTAEQAMRSVVRAELMEAIAGLMSSIMTSIPFPVNLALAAGAGALATSTLDKALAEGKKLKFAEGGIVPGVGNQDTVPAMLTPGEVILNQAQQQNLVNGMGITINIQGNVLGTREFVRDTLVPEISRAVRYS
jgi:hypothetical protein|tara:strand:+ start:219 stop:1865 length:1647 start_codon:yes stop_codon:yes gene_type:complete